MSCEPTGCEDERHRLQRLSLHSPERTPTPSSPKRLKFSNPAPPECDNQMSPSPAERFHIRRYKAPTTSSVVVDPVQPVGLETPGCRRRSRHHDRVSVERSPVPVTNHNPFTPNFRSKRDRPDPIKVVAGPMAQPVLPPTPQKVTSPASVGGVNSRYHSDFEEISKIGSGSFGTVFKVKKRLDGCHYAVKVTNKSIKGITDKNLVLKEVYALAAVCNEDDNPHIVRYFSAWEEDGRIFIQTELCSCSLEDMVNRGMQFSEAELRSFLRQVLLGLKHLHEHRLVHLDIKPANIFEKHGKYKIGDFGLATVVRGACTPLASARSPLAARWARSDSLDSPRSKLGLFSSGPLQPPPPPPMLSSRHASPSFDGETMALSPQRSSDGGAYINNEQEGSDDDDLKTPTFAGARKYVGGGYSAAPLMLRSGSVSSSIQEEVEAGMSTPRAGEDALASVPPPYLSTPSARTPVVSAAGSGTTAGARKQVRIGEVVRGLAVVPPPPTVRRGGPGVVVGRKRSGLVCDLEMESEEEGEGELEQTVWTASDVDLDMTLSPTLPAPRPFVDMLAADAAAVQGGGGTGAAAAAAAIAAVRMPMPPPTSRFPHSPVPPSRQGHGAQPRRSSGDRVAPSTVRKHARPPVSALTPLPRLSDDGESGGSAGMCVDTPPTSVRRKHHLSRGGGGGGVRVPTLGGHGGLQYDEDEEKGEQPRRFSGATELGTPLVASPERSPRHSFASSVGVSLSVGALDFGDVDDVEGGLGSSSSPKLGATAALTPNWGAAAAAAVEATSRHGCAVGGSRKGLRVSLAGGVPASAIPRHVQRASASAVAAATAAAMEVMEGDSRYLSKEMLDENYSDLPKCDIFSLGATAYELLLARPLPPNGPEWVSLREGVLQPLPGVTPELVGLLTRMMHPDPRVRPTAAELLTKEPLLRSEEEVRLAAQLAEERARSAILAKELLVKTMGLEKCKLRRSNSLW